MAWNQHPGQERLSLPDRSHNMALRQVALAHKHVATLSALKVYPGHLPLDAFCLDELTQMGLIRLTRAGYALTPRGLETLNAEVASARLQ